MIIKILRSIARGAAFFGTGLMAFVLVTPGNQTVESFTAGVLIAVGSQLGWD